MKSYIVNTSQEIRLDRYIRRIVPSITQGVIEKSLRGAKILVNGKKAKSNLRLIDQDKVEIAYNLLDEENEIKKSYSSAVISLADKLLGSYLIFKCKHFIAIDKPCGLAVQGGSKISLSIDDALGYMNQSQTEKYKLVHRLDKNTSGILLIAIGYENARILGDAFKDKEIKKTYHAVLCGVLLKKHGVISNKISKNDKEYEIVDINENGLIAETEYALLKTNQQYSLVEFKPKTGRTHQLRVHSKFLACPILGDVKYGGDKYVRMMLHASNISIPESIFGKSYNITSKMPNEFNSVL